MHHGIWYIEDRRRVGFVRSSYLAVLANTTVTGADVAAVL